MNVSSRQVSRGLNNLRKVPREHWSTDYVLNETSTPRESKLGRHTPLKVLNLMLLPGLSGYNLWYHQLGDESELALNTVPCEASDEKIRDWTTNGMCTLRSKTHHMHTLNLISENICFKIPAVADPFCFFSLRHYWLLLSVVVDKAKSKRAKQPPRESTQLAISCSHISSTRDVMCASFSALVRLAWVWDIFRVIRVWVRSLPTPRWCQKGNCKGNHHRQHSLLSIFRGKVNHKG